MPSRRALLAALTAGLAGCNVGPSGQPTRTPTPTDTATPTETPVPVPDRVADALGDAELEDAPVCPAAAPCFHEYDRHAEPETVVVPEAERLSPSNPSTTLRTYNLSTDPLVVGTPVWTGKWTDLHWTPTVGPEVPTDVEVIEPGASLAREIRMDGWGDGRYAVVEEGYHGDPRSPATVRPEGEPRRLRGETFRFGAVVAVEGSDWTIEPDSDVQTEREGETLHVEPDRAGDRTLVVTTADQSTGLPLVEESVASFPPLKNAVLALRREGVQRVTLPTDGTAWWYLHHAQVYPQDVDDDQALRVGDVVFHAHVE